MSIVAEYLKALDYFMNFDPFTIFNFKSTYEDKAFKETLELLIIMSVLIWSV